VVNAFPSIDYQPACDQHYPKTLSFLQRRAQGFVNLAEEGQTAQAKTLNYS